MFRNRLILIFGIIATLLIVGYFISYYRNLKTQTPQERKFAVKIFQHKTLGPILIGINGKTLYVFTKDQNNTQSACYGGCEIMWPFLAAYDGFRVEPGLNRNNFNTISRKNGGLQITYRGQPLYFYSLDANPGETRGDKIGNVWFIARP